ncbi:hypothetical protein EG68_09405 [Paragonimus skrjabini miyazakii]|uniref:Integrase catalytic domain-containing protein n=1 Tax=Paragonimus skrjabini miyazakii TaxID=59628 RepID=A0A8S9YHM9_9TREM|nr:hypothetical protein EG68_09405 [Paragonimus skrjabini miyazakii]
MQSEDPDLHPINQRLLKGQSRPTKQDVAGTSWETRCIWALWPKLVMQENVLYFQGGPAYLRRIVVPTSTVTTVLRRLHEELGNSGQNKTEEAARRRFWWPHMRRDVALYCLGCTECAQFKSSNQHPRAPLQFMTAGFPNEMIRVDIIGPLPETARGNRYVLVMVDYFTKCCGAIPIPATDAWTIANSMFNEWILRWSTPYQLHSDRGSNFESMLMREMCHILNIKKSRTTFYHPEGNGLVERTNRTLRNLLKAFLNHENTRDWDIVLPRCLLAYRATVYASTG